MATEQDHEFMKVAIEEGRKGRSEGGVPIGACLVDKSGKLLGSGHNKHVQMGSVIRHGEMDCLENIGRLPASVYNGATLYTTLSPCYMCSGAMLFYGIPRVVLGENETFKGAEDLLRAKGVEVINLNSAACKAMMDEFISAEPTLWVDEIRIEK